MAFKIKNTTADSQVRLDVEGRDEPVFITDEEVVLTAEEYDTTRAQIDSFIYTLDVEYVEDNPEAPVVPVVTTVDTNKAPKPTKPAKAEPVAEPKVDESGANTESSADPAVPPAE